MYSKNFFYCISIIFSLYNEMYFLLDMGWKERKIKNTQKADAQKVEGERRRGRQRMRWEDCVKIDLEREGGEWRTTAIYRIIWRRLTENAVREK